MWPFSTKSANAHPLEVPHTNRDPRRFDNPHAFRIDRPNVREHIAFGRGVHACPRSPLARAEGRITLERVLDRMADIRISEARHGRPGSLLHLRANLPAARADQAAHRVQGLVSWAHGAGRQTGTTGRWAEARPQ
jgi:Cytochrome P450